MKSLNHPLGIPAMNWLLILPAKVAAGVTKNLRDVRGRAGRLRTRLAIYRASRIIVTPFTAFILSDHYLSSEVDELALNWLNRKSRSFRSGSAQFSKCRLVFCQVDQLEEFAESYLPKIKSRFVLLTGKWGLPSLTVSDTVFEILNHPLVVSWFSQNQVFRELPIAPFPYGVEVRGAPAVVREARRAQKKVGLRNPRLLIPHARVHPHLEGASRSFREQMLGVMGPTMSHKQYLSEIGRHMMVLSPGGDRPDTYRHWECIALGAVPVSNVRPELAALFHNDMLYAENVVSAQQTRTPEQSPLSTLWRVRIWKKRVNSNFQSKLGEKMLYIDAGTGSMLLAAIAGGAAGLVYYVRLSYVRLSKRLKSLFARKPV